MESYRKRKIAFELLLLLACILAVIFVGRALEQGQTKEQPRADASWRNTLQPSMVFDDEKNKGNGQLTSILLIGTDRATDETASPSRYRNGGQADFLMLIVIDDQAKTIQTIPIDRDTISEITILGVLGDNMGVRDTQICLAYGFGDGDERSCQLQTKAVSTLFGGIPIQYYFAMRLDGIPALNDAAGGVTVTLQDDFSAMDAQMVRGQTLTLNGEQAAYYVRKRLNIGEETNESRMARQEEYLQNFYQALKQKMAEDGSEQVLQTLLEEIDPYVSTNMARGRIMNTIWNARDYALLNTTQIEGTHSTGADGFVEFHADQAMLAELINKIFYGGDATENAKSPTPES